MNLIQIKILFIVLGIILYIITINLNFVIRDTKINFILDQSIDDLKRNYDINTYHNKKTADSLDNYLSNNKEIINILKAAKTADESQRKALRKELYTLLIDKYKTLKTRGVKIILFANPDNTTFLRLHKPEKFADDLSNVRHSIVMVNKTKKAIFGLEQGKVSHAFRHVYPLFDEDKNYLGCFDISFSTDSMQETLLNINKIHNHLLIKKELFDSKVFQTNNKDTIYEQSLEHKDYFIQKQS